jgi:hypothetical protein
MPDSRCLGLIAIRHEMTNQILPASNVKRRHFLPAGSIGYFSASTAGPLRGRQIFVLRKDHQDCYPASAEYVGRSKVIYGIGKYWDWDNYFRSSEPLVHSPVDRIMRSAGGNEIPLQDWASLAWYVAMLFTRGPDFEWELEAQLRAEGQPTTNVTPGYAIDGQRIGAAVARARWEFVWTPEKPWILGDRGITGLLHSRWKTPAYIVPIRKDFAAVVGAGPFQKQIKWDGAQWLIEIPSHKASGSTTEEMNALAWHASRQEIYGPTPEPLFAARAHATGVPAQLAAIAPLYRNAQLLGMTQPERMKDDMLLFTMMGGLRPPGPGEEPYLHV